MTLWVVRHGSAGRKRDWTGDDDRRPLDARGRAQAEVVADLLGPRRPRRLRSSPTLRCLQTLAPLAGRIAVEVEPDDVLRVDGFPGGLLALLDEAGAPGDVLCSHGELLRPALRELRRRGAVGEWSDDVLLAKGSVWEIDPDGPSLVLLRPAPAPPRPR
jgi:8-oxo-(d)GTP phosphatase